MFDRNEDRLAVLVLALEEISLSAGRLDDVKLALAAAHAKEPASPKP